MDSHAVNRSASITRPFADGEYHFAYPFGELVKLQEARDCGPQVLQQRLLGNDWRVEDIREVIRFGLIGGGMTPVEASKLVKRWVEERPPLENLELAGLLSLVAINGPPDERVGEQGDPDAPPNGSTTSQAANSESPPSTQQAA